MQSCTVMHLALHVVSAWGGHLGGDSHLSAVVHDRERLKAAQLLKEADFEVTAHRWLVATALPVSLPRPAGRLLRVPELCQAMCCALPSL